MDGATQGFDRKNAWLYKTAVAVLLVAIAVVFVRIATGYPPDYVTDSFASGGLFLLCGILAAASLWGLENSNIRGFYLFVAPLAVFVAAGYVSGFPGKGLAILSVGAGIMLVICVLMGDKADLNTREHRIRIRLPW